MKKYNLVGVKFKYQIKSNIFSLKFEPFSYSFRLFYVVKFCSEIGFVQTPKEITFFHIMFCVQAINKFLTLH